MAARDTFLDPWLCLVDGASGPHPLVVEALASLTLTESRARQRRPVDLLNHQALVDTIIANLSWATLFASPPHAVACPLSRPIEKSTRYDRKGMRKLRETLVALDACGVLHLHVSQDRTRLSTFRPSDEFPERVRRLGIGMGDFGRADGEEVIWLGRTERDYAADKRVRHLIDYADTDETERLRADLDAINAHLAQADIDFLGQDPTVSLAKHRMHRVFNLPSGFPEDRPRFDMGGRLFGAWWETSDSKLRHLVRIDGEPVTELDYSAMFARLAYLHVAVTPPAGDLYRRVAGIVTAEHRDGIKQILNALWFRDEPLKRLPKGAGALLPAELRSAPAVVAAILEAYPALADAMKSRIGYRLMRTESDIMVAVLLRLAVMGITALPLHDGLLVPASRAGIAEAVMGDVPEQLVGHRLPVRRKEPDGELQGGHRRPNPYLATLCSRWALRERDERLLLPVPAHRHRKSPAVHRGGLLARSHH